MKANDKNQSVWITGGSTGIGAETGKRLARDGHTVFLTARSEDKLKALEKESENFSGKIISMPGDVTDKDGIAEVFEKIEEHGPLDVLICNAGTFDGKGDDSVNAETLEMTYRLNIFGTAYTMEPVLKKFSERSKGHIVLVGSVAGFRGLPRSIAYGSSKAALINMAEALYMEYKPQGVKVQIANPGFVRTPLTDKNDFEMPMLMEVEDAAKAFVKGLYSNQFEINFPWLFCTIKKVIDLLPNKAYLWLAGRLKT